VGVVSEKRKLKVIIAKIGLDGHDRGAKVVARALKESGIEVIYTGLHRTPEEVVEMALEEDVDAIGISILSGAHMTVFKKVLELLKEKGLEDVVVFGGGIIPEGDAEQLLKMGVKAIYGPGTKLSKTIADLKEWFPDAEIKEYEG
jgi:methylmalonyl-CoA mutase C-terminal domain/subunit